MRSDRQDWFTVEPLDSRTFAISEYGHWEHVHAYLFIGRERAALVDTGTGIGDIGRVVRTLTHQPVLVVTTHCHWDHIGGHHAFAEVAIHEADRAWLEDGIPVPIEVIRQQVIKEPFTLVPPSDFSPEDYVPYTGTPTLVLQDENTIDLGDRVLRILHTPGHSPGHICVHEEARGYLATGDLVYEGTLFANYPSTDPVAFGRSVARLMSLPYISTLLPGHNRLDLPVSHLITTHQAFEALAGRDQLRHGTGLHPFGSVAIRL